MASRRISTVGGRASKIASKASNFKYSSDSPLYSITRLTLPAGNADRTTECTLGPRVLAGPSEPAEPRITADRVASLSSDAGLAADVLAADLLAATAGRAIESRPSARKLSSRSVA